MGKEIGIDFGTTNTVISYVNKRGLMRSLKYENEDIIPSAIYFRSQADCIIGDQARKMCRCAPDSGVVNFKPIIGSRERVKITAENGETFRYSMQKVAERYLQKLIEGIERRLIKEFGPEGCIGDVVLTVPAKFNAVEKSAVKKAAKAAGFGVVKVAAEPTAAAFAYQQEMEQKDETIMVYDFGGGTFDVSVIQSKGGRFSEIASDGDKGLGGNTITALLARHFFALISEEYGIELPFDPDDFDPDELGISEADYLKDRFAVFEEANQVKEALSDEPETEAQIVLTLPGHGGAETVTWISTVGREAFEAIIRRTVQRTIDITRRVMREVCDKENISIDTIVLAGGSSRIPLVREMMGELIDRQQVYSEDIYTLISRGAAYLAQQELDDVTESVTNIQYGVAVSTGAVFKTFKTIIPEGQKLPCTGKHSFRLNKDGQTSVKIPYYERDIKNHPQSVRSDDDGITEIDTLVISNLPAGLKKDDVQIEVSFTLQKEGTLEIHAEVLDRAGMQITSAGIVCEKASNLE